MRRLASRRGETCGKVLRRISWARRNRLILIVFLLSGFFLFHAGYDSYASSHPRHLCFKIEESALEDLDREAGFKIAMLTTWDTPCGIATFAKALREGILAFSKDVSVSIVKIASSSGKGALVMEPPVKIFVRKQRISDYQRAALLVNKEFDAVIVQHEFGIFGGQMGSFVLEFMQLVDVPLVSVLHTIQMWDHPSLLRILRRVMQLSSAYVTLEESPHPLLEALDVSSDCAQIPHGVAPRSLCSKEQLRAALCARERWNSKDLIVFVGGLANENKRWKEVIHSISRINGKGKRSKRVRLVIASHPADNADARKYITEVQQAAQRYTSDISYIGKFLETAELAELVSACDVTILHYPNLEQVSSGMLVLSLGLGTPVLSTGFRQAISLESKGVSLFEDMTELEASLSKLLRTRSGLRRLESECAKFGDRSWPVVGSTYLDVFRGGKGRKTWKCKSSDWKQDQTHLLPAIFSAGSLEVWFVQKYFWLASVPEPFSFAGDFIRLSSLDKLGQSCETRLWQGELEFTRYVKGADSCVKESVQVCGSSCTVEKCIKVLDEGTLIKTWINSICPKNIGVELVSGLDNLSVGKRRYGVLKRNLLGLKLGDTVLRAEFDSECVVNLHPMGGGSLKYVEGICPKRQARIFLSLKTGIKGDRLV